MGATRQGSQEARGTKVLARRVTIWGRPAVPGGSRETAQVLETDSRNSQVLKGGQEAHGTAGERARGSRNEQAGFALTALWTPGDSLPGGAHG